MTAPRRRDDERKVGRFDPGVYTVRMLLNRSTRTLPFLASLLLVAASAFGLVVGMRKGMPKGVTQLELVGALPQTLASLALLAFAVGVAGFVRAVEVRIRTAVDQDSDARNHSSLVLGAGVAAGVLHAVAGITLIANDSRAEVFRAFASAESLASALMVIAALPAFRAAKRTGATVLGAFVLVGLLVRGSLVMVKPGRFESNYAIDPMDMVWIATSLGFGIWTIVASISSTAPDRTEDAPPPSTAGV